MRSLVTRQPPVRQARSATILCLLGLASGCATPAADIAARAALTEAHLALHDRVYPYRASEPDTLGLSGEEDRRARALIERDTALRQDTRALIERQAGGLDLAIARVFLAGGAGEIETEVDALDKIVVPRRVSSARINIAVRDTTSAQLEGRRMIMRVDGRVVAEPLPPGSSWRVVFTGALPAGRHIVRVFVDHVGFGATPTGKRIDGARFYNSAVQTITVREREVAQIFFDVEDSVVPGVDTRVPKITVRRDPGHTESDAPFP